MYITCWVWHAQGAHRSSLKDVIANHHRPSWGLTEICNPGKPLLSFPQELAVSRQGRSLHLGPRGDWVPEVMGIGHGGRSQAGRLAGGQRPKANLSRTDVRERLADRWKIT